MKRALVTGANGFIGSHLVDYLLQKQYRVRCLVRKTSNLRWIADLDVELVYGSLDDQASLESALQDINLVFHLAGVTKAIDLKIFDQGNVTGTQNLLEIIADHRMPIQRFVYVSTQAAVGPSQDLHPVAEDAIPDPRTRYGRSKLAAERVVQHYASVLPVTIVRPSSVFGPRDTDVLSAFRSVHYRIQPVLGWGERYASFIYVEDLVRGLVLAAENPLAAGNVYHLVTEPSQTWKSFNGIIAEVIGRRGIRIHVPLTLFGAICLINDGISRVTRKPAILNWDKTREFNERFWLLDGSKSEAELGFHAQFDFRTAIEKTYRWYVEAGWL